MKELKKQLQGVRKSKDRELSVRSFLYSPSFFSLHSQSVSWFSLSVCLSVCLSVLSVCLSARPSVLSICLSVCLPTSPIPLCVCLQELNEKIAHLKDQLQELKAKTGLESKFVKKSTQV